MNTLQVLDLGIKDYEYVWKLQKILHKERVEGKREDLLLLLEHNPVYTIGKDGKEENIIARPSFLKKEKIKVYKVDRGGDVTYHGPGQLVGYPIICLTEKNLTIEEFVRGLEEIFIMFLGDYGISAKRIPKYTGVWVGQEKILAIGVKVAMWTTMHGFAFNINPNLSHFSGIIPCGIYNKGVTSLEKILNPLPSYEEIKEKVIFYFCKVFNFEKVNTSGGDIWKTLKDSARKNS